MNFYCRLFIVASFFIKLTYTQSQHKSSSVDTNFNVLKNSNSIAFYNVKSSDSNKLSNISKFLSGYNSTVTGNMTKKEESANALQASPKHIAGSRRQGRSQQIIPPVANPYPYDTIQYSPGYSNGQPLYNQMPLVQNNGDVSSTLESPYLYTRRQGYDDETGNHGYYEYSTEAPDENSDAEDAEDEEEEDEEESDDTGETTTTTEAPPTTTLAPFTLADVKVPAPFLRIEYMISFTFFGVMYGLGFFVLFQSLCVPAAKIAVYIVYIFLLKFGVVDPVTLEQALEQLPPT